MEAAHDSICESILRVVHLVVEERDFAVLRAAHEHFADTYVEHSRQEQALFDELGALLDGEQMTELAQLLHGL